MTIEEAIKAAAAIDLGWSIEYIQGNGFDCDVWITPDKTKAYCELPTDFRDAIKYPKN